MPATSWAEEAELRRLESGGRAAEEPRAKLAPRVDGGGGVGGGGEGGGGTGGGGEGIGGEGGGGDGGGGVDGEADVQADAQEEVPADDVLSHLDQLRVYRQPDTMAAFMSATVGPSLRVAPPPCCLSHSSTLPCVPRSLCRPSDHVTHCAGRH